MLKPWRANEPRRRSGSQWSRRAWIACTLALAVSACSEHTTAAPKAQADSSESKRPAKKETSMEDSAPEGSAGKSAVDTSAAGMNAAGARADAAGSSAAGMPANSAGASGAVSGEPELETFRIGELSLRDPHLFVGNTDVTDRSVLGVSVNLDLIPGGLTKDYDNDGFIDVSVVARLDANKRLHLIDARCAPADPNTCMQHPSPGLDVEWPVEEVQTGACLTLPTSSNYKPAAQVPATPCLLTQGGRDVAMTLGGVPIEMTDTQIALRRDGKNLTGLIAGFVTLEKAQSALLPSYVPVLAGSPLARYLRESDRDDAKSPTGDDGFWFYVNFGAEPASYAQ